ncbi:MAG: hypothetical protein KA354_13860 [Phycisphaerae bacterium]|nr:hypothetical protein [Phycisphaerae bacterium]
MRTLTDRFNRRMIVGLGIVLGAVLAGGCKTDEIAGPERTKVAGPTTDLETPAGIQVPDIKTAGRTELDLVEEMILHRTMYARLLRALANYYNENGNAVKEAWARTELNDLKYVKPYRYISDTEAPASELKPTQSIAEADKLFNEGRALMKKGGSEIPGLYNQRTMKLALAKFNEVVDNYPSSDKVADAAFYIAEIHKEYFEEKDNTIAAEWYRKALLWNPSIQHPVRFQLAVLLDYRLHERENALAMYQEVVENERSNKSNLDFAYRRIAQLTDEKTRHSPGEIVSQPKSSSTSTPPPPPAGIIEVKPKPPAPTSTQ